MGLYVMKDEYYTGNSMIDEEHAKLIDIINRACDLAQNEFISDKYDNIRDIIQELVEYTHLHFSHEEEYMEKIHYRGMFMQKVQHKSFCEKLESYDLNTIDKYQQDVLLDLMNYLGDWLVNHILEEDKQIKGKE